MQAVSEDKGAAQLMGINVNATITVTFAIGSALAAVAGVLDAFEEECPKSGYVTNIQGDLAVSANKRGVLVEPMSAFRARRKK